MYNYMKIILSAVKIYIDKAVDLISNKIPTKLSDLDADIELGVTSWDELEDKPFGTKETNVFTITFTDSTTGILSISGEELYLYDGLTTAASIKSDTLNAYDCPVNIYGDESGNTYHMNIYIDTDGLNIYGRKSWNDSDFIKVSITNNNSGMPINEGDVWTFTFDDLFLTRKVQLDEEYIPDTIARVEDVSNTFGKVKTINGVEPDKNGNVITGVRPFPVFERTMNSTGTTMTCKINFEDLQLLRLYNLQENDKDYKVLAKIVIICDDGTEKNILSTNPNNIYHITISNDTKKTLVDPIGGSAITVDYSDKSTADNIILTYDNVIKYLSIYNRQEYTPTGDYNPATKKYVDDTISAEISSSLEVYTNAIQQLENNKINTLIADVSGENIIVNDSLQDSVKTLIVYGKTLLHEPTNLFDGKLEQGTLDNTTGKPTAHEKCIRTDNFISVEGNRSITITNNKNYYCRLYEYDSSQNCIAANTAYSSSPAIFTTKSDTRYIKFRSDQSNQETDLTVKYFVKYTDDVEHLITGASDGEINIQINNQSFVIPVANGLNGAMVDSSGNYVDENNQQWVTDTVDLIHGIYTQRVSIDEDTLTVNVLDSPIESEIVVDGSLMMSYPSTVVVNDENLPMKLEYKADAKLYIDKKFEYLKNLILNSNM